MELYVTKTTYEKNANDGIEVHKSRQALAETVLCNEQAGGRVQVFRCVPVKHTAYVQRAAIDFEDE